LATSTRGRRAQPRCPPAPRAPHLRPGLSMVAALDAFAKAWRAPQGWDTRAGAVGSVVAVAGHTQGADDGGRGCATPPHCAVTTWHGRCDVLFGSGLAAATGGEASAHSDIGWRTAGLAGSAGVAGPQGTHIGTPWGAGATAVPTVAEVGRDTAMAGDTTCKTGAA
jgi:hypothetical protein